MEPVSQRSDFSFSPGKPNSRLVRSSHLFGQPRLVSQPEFTPEYQVGERETELEDALTLFIQQRGMGQSTLRNLARQALTYLAQNPPTIYCRDG